MTDDGWSCSEWTAEHDHMPGKPQTLRVRGTCMMPAQGYKVTLERAVPQGANVNDLLLHLIVREPEFGSPAMMRVEATYEERTEFEYDTVTIVGQATVPVRCLEKA